MMPVLGVFLDFNSIKESHFHRKTRKIIQNKTNQETIKKTKRNSRLHKMKIICEVMF